MSNLTLEFIKAEGARKEVFSAAVSALRNARDALAVSQNDYFKDFDAQIAAAAEQIARAKELVAELRRLTP